MGQAWVWLRAWLKDDAFGNRGVDDAYGVNRCHVVHLVREFVNTSHWPAPRQENQTVDSGKVPHDRQLNPVDNQVLDAHNFTLGSSHSGLTAGC